MCTNYYILQEIKSTLCDTVKSLHTCSIWAFYHRKLKFIDSVQLALGHRVHITPAADKT